MLLCVIVYLAFFKRKSFFSPSPFPITSIFDINELSWIPSEVRELLRNKINFEIIPALTNLSNSSWNALSSTEKTDLLGIMTSDMDNLKTILESSSPISIKKKRHSPSSPSE